MLEWLFAWPAFGMAELSSSLLIVPVGLFADVSVLVVALDDEVVDPDEVSVDEVPVGALDVAELGVPEPVGLVGEAGSGGAADSLVVEGVTGGTALVVDA